MCELEKLWWEMIMQKTISRDKTISLYEND